MAAGIIQSLGDLFFKISPDMGDFGKQLESGVAIAAGSTIATVGTAIEALGKSITKKFTLPLAVATAANIAQFQALDREIRSTLTLFGTAPALVDETFNAMAAGIRGVSTEVGGLEKDIADGLYQAISAGVPRGDVFEFLDIAQMAAIADKTADLTTSVDGITTAVNAFSVEGLTAGNAADIMFATVAKGKTTFGELSQSMGRSAGLAANAGVKFSEFSAIIGAITLGGFQTSEAVSFLRAAITGLLRPGEEMNKVFQDLGYESAEAAIPIIGLQPAFQAVVDAAGGSTSKLQELIGTSEGVSAILAVTGDNADKFAGVLGGVENSAGATARAFAIADAGIGRTFGKMTEAFDRLANTFGAWGSALAEPVVKAITGIVNAFVGMVDFVKPVVDGFAAGVSALMKVFDVPIIKQFVAGVVGLGLAFSAILGVLGPLIWAVGHLLITYSKFKATKYIFKALKNSFSGLKSVSEAVGTSVERFAEQLSGKYSKSTDKAAKATGALGKQMQTMKAQALFAGLAIVAIVAAIGTAIFIYTKYKDKLKEVEAQTLITTQGIDRMAASMNETLAGIGEINLETATPTEFITNFQTQNADAISGIVDTLHLVNSAAAEDQIIGIAFEADRRGMSPDGVKLMVESLQELTGVKFKFDFNALGNAAQLDQLDAQIGKISQRIVLAGDDVGAAFDHFSPGNKLRGDVAEIADELVNIFNVQGADVFEAQLIKVGEAIGDDRQLVNFLSDEVLTSFEDIMNAGEGLGFDIGSFFGDTTNIGDVLDQLNSKDFYSGHVIGATEAAVAIDGMIEKREQWARIDAQKTLASGILVDPEQIEIAEGLADEMATAFQTAEQYVSDAFGAIQTGIMNQLPVLSIYTGAIKQSFTEWSKGQTQFQKDIVLVADFRKELKKLAPEVVDSFDQSAIGEQVWLATLGPENQLAAIEQLKASSAAGMVAVGTVSAQEATGIFAEAESIISAEATRLYGLALESGAGVGVNFANSLNESAKQWPIIAAHWMNAVALLIGGGDIGSINMDGPEINANITVTNQEINVTTADPTGGKGVSQALQGVGHWN